MSAMSRSFAAPGGLVTEAMREYYAKRAKAGLILNAAPQAAASGFSAADFYAGPMDQLQVDPATGMKADGFVWGVPRDVSTFALYLNLDLIDQVSGGSVENEFSDFNFTVN